MSATSSSASTTAAPGSVLAELCSLPADADAVQRSCADGWDTRELPAGLADKLRNNPSRGMKPGSIHQHDFRPRNKQTAAAASDSSEHNKPLRVIQWNIERGYKLSAIIELLRAQQADIIVLQEVDVGCARSGWLDTGVEIARALGFNYSFISEFVEVYSPLLRTPPLQGGGVHGNAILSRFDHVAARAIRHEFESYDWHRRGHEVGEPRIGGRYTLYVAVQVPWGGAVGVYSTHLEVFSGILGRLRNMSEVLSDCRAMYDETALLAASETGEHHEAQSAAARRAGKVAYQLICGDLNTLSHGIARLSPHYSNDVLRLRSLGWTEAEWWVRHVFHNAGPEVSPMLAKLTAHPASKAASLLPPSIQRELINDCGFHDPFDSYAHSTLSNYRGWFQGKLDWMLLRNLTPTSRVHHKDSVSGASRHRPSSAPHENHVWLANTDYSASDHAMLGVELLFDQPSPLDFATAATVATAAAKMTTRQRRGSKSGRAAVSPMGSEEAAAAASSASASSSHAASSASASRFPSKSAAHLRRLMPLTRRGPGLVTSSATNAAIWVPQIIAFWALMIAIAWIVWTKSGP